MAEPIVYWNRKNKREEIEQVYGGALVRALYETRGGQLIADYCLSKPFLSKLYGLYQDSNKSSGKIHSFVKSFNINLEEYEDRKFTSFNDFFTRKFKPGMRKFVQEQNALPAFCEARYLAFEKISDDTLFPVKGSFLSPRALLGDRPLAKEFAGGPLMIARLCPTDYHRFHFPDDGKILEHYRLEGGLHSVNPVALKYRGDIFATNERQVTLLETKNFGKLAYVEVGALCVGKIVQSRPMTGTFTRGEEKGYFLFGASTVIIMGQAKAFKPDADLLEQTASGRESFIELGEKIASR